VAATGTATLTLPGEASQTGLQLEATAAGPTPPAGAAAVRGRRAGGRAPSRSGDAIEAIALGLPQPGEAFEATIAIRGDFGQVGPAVTALAARGDAGPFGDAPFRRAPLVSALLAELGAATGEATPLAVQAPRPDAAAFPPARVAGPFQRFCSPCHRTPAASPPNFLHGDEATVSARLAHCADRIRFRLAMWRLPPAARAKTPMPPEPALPALHADAASWPTSPELAALDAYASQLAGGGAPPRPDHYETLRPCLPPAPG
jgi:hypothetical protein